MPWHRGRHGVLRPPDRRRAERSGSAGSRRSSARSRCATTRPTTAPATSRCRTTWAACCGSTTGTWASCRRRGSDNGVELSAARTSSRRRHPARLCGVRRSAARAAAADADRLRLQAVALGRLVLRRQQLAAVGRRARVALNIVTRRRRRSPSGASGMAGTYDPANHLSLPDRRPAHFDRSRSRAMFLRAEYLAFGGPRWRSATDPAAALQVRPRQGRQVRSVLPQVRAGTPSSRRRSPIESISIGRVGRPAPPGQRRLRTSDLRSDSAVLRYTLGTSIRRCKARPGSSCQRRGLRLQRLRRRDRDPPRACRSPVMRSSIIAAPALILALPGVPRSAGQRTRPRASANLLPAGSAEVP